VRFFFFFVWNVANAFVNLVLLFCDLFVSYYVIVNSLLLWSPYVSATSMWPVGVVVW
jgi:hypothetical protein